ncbi:MAG: glycosyltransferase family 2 protein [Clostridiaceae bacterium]|nr:glycosyltransferase family 2 protein [Clostridiaceae bacterium]
MPNEYISIFIPVYNGGRYLRDSWASLSRQTVSCFRVLYVDDSSTDNSWEILQELALSDERIQIYRKTNEGNVPFSWCYVFPKIETEFTLYMSQDDWLAEDCLERLLERQQETQADAVVCTVEFYQGGGVTAPRIDAGVKGDLTPILSGRQAYELALDYSIPGFCLWRTELIREVGMKTDAYNSDELAQRLWFLHSPVVAFSSGRFYYRQDNPQAITKTFSYQKYSSVLTDIHLYESMLSEGVEPALRNRLKGRYFSTVLYLNAVFLCRRQSYTKEQQQEVQHIMSEGRRIFSPLPWVSAHNAATWLAARNVVFFWLISFLFAWRLHTKND